MSTTTLIQAALKSTLAGVLMDPSIKDTKVKLLPRLQFYGLSLQDSTTMPSQLESLVDPIGTGFIEHIREALCSLPSQIVQMPLTSLDLIGAAHVMESALGDLLGVYCCRVVLSAGIVRHINHRRSRCPDPDRRQLASVPVWRGTEE